MQLEEGFWMRWSDNFGETFDSVRTLIPVKLPCNDVDHAEICFFKGEEDGYRF